MRFDKSAQHAYNLQKCIKYSMSYDVQFSRRISDIFVIRNNNNFKHIRNT